jgi:hypothetical protein
MMACFGPEISADKVERNHRFFEEVTELVQSTGMTRSECHQLVDYTFYRPVGEPKQETGGVMVTLAAHGLAHGIDMHEAGETELARISAPDVIVKIRAKQASKPKHSPLPQDAAPTHPSNADSGDGVKRAKGFIGEIVTAGGKYSYLNGTPIVSDAYDVLKSLSTPSEDAGELELVKAIKDEAAEWVGDYRGAAFLALLGVAQRLGVQITKDELFAISDAAYRARKGE